MRAPHPTLSQLGVPISNGLPTLDRDATVRQSRIPRTKSVKPSHFPDDDIPVIYDQFAPSPEAAMFRSPRYDADAPDTPAMVALREQCMVRTTSGVSQPTISMLSNNLFLSDAYTAQSSCELKARGITHVVCVAENPGQYFYPETYMSLPVPVCDSEHANLYFYFVDIAKWIRNAIETGGRVIVHSHYGQSRAAAAAIAYLVMCNGMAVEDALAFIRQHRSFAQPNAGFMRQLRQFESDLVMDPRSRW